MQTITNISKNRACAINSYEFSRSLIPQRITKKQKTPRFREGFIYRGASQLKKGGASPLLI